MSAAMPRVVFESTSLRVGVCVCVKVDSLPLFEAAGLCLLP